MKVRKYIGNNAQEALLKVKMDLGNEAIIINTRKVRRKGLFGIFRSKVVEVLASVDEEEQNNKKRKEEPVQTVVKEVVVEDDKKVKELEAKMRSMEEMLTKIYTQVAENNKSNAENKKVEEEKIYNLLIENMKNNDIEDDIIEELVTSIREKVDLGTANVNEVAGLLQKEIREIMGRAYSIKLEDTSKPKKIMFLGPTGVGKTTTLAKIAANFMLNENKKVGLITADTYRIAAVEQLKTYSEILGTPVTVIYSPDEVKEAMKKHDADDVVLIDTPGKSHKNKKHFEELQLLVEKAEPDEIFLLISATTKMRDCKEIVKSYGFLNDYKIIFTKVDETSSYGIILNTKKITGKSLSYITTGQSVPDDIEIINTDKISKYLLGKGI